MINTHPIWDRCVPGDILGHQWMFEIKTSQWYQDNQRLFDERIRELALWLLREKANQFKIEWDKMPRLEEVYLDLRAMNLPTTYPRLSPDTTTNTEGYLGILFVAKIAKAMSGKGLRKLVIAGLRSYNGDRGYDSCGLRDDFTVRKSVTAGRWDANRELFMDTPYAGDWWYSARRSLQVEIPNWWMMFVTAVRPGGKLIFVDREYDYAARELIEDPEVRCLDLDFVSRGDMWWGTGVPGQADYLPG
ncbi:hypothetical protein QBC41DRAFT_324428 [Cercophora samala]|uniref:Uncharacterized protein n=1 Tax=Cercophora samala TaxID=330535 RepID=A0AA39ZB56_9PEZI|nr:hypothetical protein QBC41DRAFT_324428 [Cercophora samala]